MSEDRDSQPDDAMRALLKRSLEGEPRAPDILAGVQKRIRQRSRGRFFADGWSTSQMRIHYALIAMMMLLVLVIAYVIVGPMGFSAD